MKKLIPSTLGRRTAFLAVCCIAWLGCLGNCVLVLAQPPTVVLNERVMVPMRDGVKLATFIRRPETNQKVPAILSRSPYNAAPKVEMPPREQARPNDAALSHAVITQDVRGRYASEGEFYPLINEARDGHDAVEWIARQPWCDGNVGMVGGSYVGFTQLAAAMERPPHLKAIWAQVAPGDFSDGVHFHGGALRFELVQGWMIGQAFKSQRVLRKQVPAEELARWQQEGQFAEWCWHLPLADAGAIVLGGPSYAKAWNDVLGSWQQPRAWDAASPIANVGKIIVPAMLVGGWYDIFSQDDLDLWAALRARGGSESARKETRLLMGPWVHGCRGPTGAVHFRKGELDLRELQMQWFDRWLCGKTNASSGWAALRYFVMHGDRWVDADHWPPKNATPTKFYLTRDPATQKRALATQPPAGDSPPSTFGYDPRAPVATLGGNNLNIVRGIQDHWENSRRYEVVGFETAPLEKDLTVIGRVRVHLVAASSAPDTDFTAMLLDVAPAPEGEYHPRHDNVLDGIVRARFRHGRDKDELLEPGKPVELDVDLGTTAYTFKAGHRIRLNISSSNFPRFDRNLNTADPPGRGTAMRKAENSVFHDTQHVSFMELPIAP